MIGRHLLADYEGCNPDTLDDAEGLVGLLENAAILAGARPLRSGYRRFAPQGVTVFVIVAESHLSLHTWPETKTAMGDVFTCGTRCDPEKALDYLSDVLQARRARAILVSRGTEHGPCVATVRERV